MLIPWLIASAVVTPPGLAQPDRLTAGPSNQYLGALTADGRELYFASDEESTTQIYVQELATGVPRLAFDEVADVTWPRPSPDGRALLYISYREDAAGDLCVRSISGGPGARRLGTRRCLSAPDSAELQAVWFPDSRQIALVTRAGLHGDFELRRVQLSGAGEHLTLALGAPLAEGNLANPALAPDGRTLVAVPVQRSSRQIGPSFLGRSTGTLRVIPLDGGAPRSLTFELPGATAMPAYSPDGRWLYFSQFLNDTNFDGVIDGNDHGVLFRVALSEGRTAATGTPEQLSSARWSCQYPLAGRDHLIATCLASGSLDVFALPPGGALPAAWRQLPQDQRHQRIDDELAASRDRWERLLLLAHRGGSAAVLREMIHLHLTLGEYESAAFYAARLERDGDRLAGEVLRELAAHRGAERSLARGALSGPFVVAARARLAKLGKLAHPLAALVRSEVLDTLGQEDAARAAFAEVALPAAKRAAKGVSEPPELGPLSDELVAALWADRLLALYRDQPEYFERYRPLAEVELSHAETFVRELLRGTPRDQRAAKLEHWMARVDAYGELAFLLQLERALAELSRETQEQVRERVFTLYRQNKDLARRKALIATTVRRSLAAGNDYLLYQFAESWVSYVPRELAERRRAERLYRDAVFERAYLEEAQGNRSDARGHYFGVTLQTDALEAHAAFIENRLAEGQDPSKDYPGRFSEAVQRYARAYQAARRMPAVGAAEQQRLARTALDELRQLVKLAPQRAEVHQLWGFVAHQRFLRSRDRASAVEANAHWLIALELARGNPRARAAVLDGLAQVQAAVGNHGLALTWLEERAKLPFAEPRGQLAHCLALARTRYHLGDGRAAADKAEACLTLLEASPELARFRPLALDRAALYHLDAGDGARAAARYAALWPLVESAAAPAAEAARNRFTTRLGQASAALATGEAEAALRFLDDATRRLGERAPAQRTGPFALESTTPPLPLESYRVLLHGLRARALTAAGQLEAAERAQVARRDGLRRRLAQSGLDEDRYDLAQCEAQLAELSRRRGRPASEALAHLLSARGHHRKWAEATGTELDPLGLALLVSFAELHLFAGVPQTALGFSLAQESSQSYQALGKLRNPEWEPLRARLAQILTIMKLRRGT